VNSVADMKKCYLFKSLCSHGFESNNAAEIRSHDLETLCIYVLEQNRFFKTFVLKPTTAKVKSVDTSSVTSETMSVGLPTVM